MKRHGDGRPSKARWYQSTRRTRRGAGRGHVIAQAPVERRRRARRAASSTSPPAPRTSSSAAPGRAPISSRPGGAAARARRRPRASARRRRRSRLRITAGPTARPMANATRGGHGVGIVEVAAPQRRRSGRGDHGGSVARTHAARGSGRSSRQPGAALEPPGLQDGPTGPCAHPGAEPVLAGTAAGVRLVGALHVRLRTLLDRQRRRQRQPDGRPSSLRRRATDVARRPAKATASRRRTGNVGRSAPAR